MRKKPNAAPAIPADDRGNYQVIESRLIHVYTTYLGDDFRTALQNANNCVSNLVSLARPSSPPIIVGASTSTSSVNGIPDADRPWVDTMTRLANILQKHVRVRYESNITDIVQAWVHQLLFESDHLT